VIETGGPVKVKRVLDEDTLEIFTEAGFEPNFYRTT
jgi:hypothetical protein